MKLLIVLSVIAYGYADKLDRTYLPPVNAATAGGSPGALTAPGYSLDSGFKQGLPSASGRQPVPDFGQPRPSTHGVVSGSSQANFGQGLPVASGRQPGTGTQSFRPSYGGGSGIAQNNIPVSGIDKGSFSSATGSSAVTPSGGNSQFNGANYPSGAFKGQSISSSFSPQANTFNLGSQQGPQSKGPFNQVHGQGAQGVHVGQAYTPERTQAAADRNAEILKYINENNGETYSYSYETSNGISAEESGVATNGVKAQGGFSYTGDDGQAYSLTYTADENGFRPQGEHLPTPHPIPDEILRSIEENARAAAAGTQEGAYRPEEYESEAFPQQTSSGLSSFNIYQGQSQIPSQGSFPHIQSNQVSGNQGSFGQNAVNGQLSQISQTRPSHESNQFASVSTGAQEQNGQFQHSHGANNQVSSGQFPRQGSVGQVVGQISKGQNLESSGYNYKQPQNIFRGTQLQSGLSTQNRPQSNGQGQKGSVSGSRNEQGTVGLNAGNGATSGIPFGTSQGSQANQPTVSVGNYGQEQQTQVNANKPFFSTTRPENQGSTKSSGQGYHYQPNAFKPSFGPNRPSSIISQFNPSSQYKPNANQAFLVSNNEINQGTAQFGVKNADPSSVTGQASLFQQNRNQQSFAGNIASNQGSSSISSRIQKTGPGSPSGQANQPSLGFEVGPTQGLSRLRPGSQTFGSTSSVQGSPAPKDSKIVQAPYQYNRPIQSFTPQQYPGSQVINAQSSPGTQSINRPSGGFSGSIVNNELSSGVSIPREQSVNMHHPGGSFPGSQGVNGQLPGTSSTGYQGENAQRPSFNTPGSQSVNVRPGLNSLGTESMIGQHPGSNLSGSSERHSQGSQGRPEQFGGPRQPPSFNPQEGYKY